MKRSINSMTTSLNTNESNSLVRDEIVESSNSIRTTSNTGDNSIREFTLLFCELGFDLPTNDPLEITDDSWERMGTDGRTDEVVGVI